MRSPQSVRLRLLIGAAICVSLALVVSGIALVTIFESTIERRTRDDLMTTRNRLVAAIAPAPVAAHLEQTLTDPRYATPFGGLYWQVENLNSGEVNRSRSLWDTKIAFPQSEASGEPSYLTLDGPSGQMLSVLGGVVAVDGPGGQGRYLVSVARDRADADEAIRRFGWEMSLDLSILGVALVLAAWVQVNLGLRPLGRLAEAVETIRSGRAERLGSEYPTEVLPLVKEVNELLAARDKSIETARFRAAELAHSLKTPMAVVSATAERLKAAGDSENAATLAALSEEVSDEIDYHLRLTALRPRDSTTVLRTSLNAALLRTISVLRKTPYGEALHWKLELGKDTQVDIDEHDLLELVGILVENAAKWASSQVEVSTVAHENEVVTCVFDDGPGLTEEQIARIGVRGQRLNRDKPGSGFGLSIALEIVVVNKGTLTFGRSDAGGLAVTLTLPQTD